MAVTTMEKQYVEYRDNGYWIPGSRVSLDSVVIAFQDGLSPETIATECFPTLSLEQVHGAIAYYLGHCAEIDAYLEQADEEFSVLRQAIRKRDPEFSRKLNQARRQLQTANS